MSTELPTLVQIKLLIYQAHQTHLIYGDESSLRLVRLLQKLYSYTLSEFKQTRPLSFTQRYKHVKQFDFSEERLQAFFV